MKPYAHALREFDSFYHQAVHSPSKASFKRLFDLIRDGVPTMTLEAVERVRGTIVDTHIRGQIAGHKFEHKHQSRGPVVPIHVAMCVVEAVARTMGGTGREMVAGALVPDLEPLLEKALSNPKNRDKARMRAAENQKILEAANHKEALERLQQTLASWPYTREEVLDAWNLQQVKEVMES